MNFVVVGHTTRHQMATTMLTTVHRDMGVKHSTLAVVRFADVGVDPPPQEEGEQKVLTQRVASRVVRFRHALRGQRAHKVGARVAARGQKVPGDPLARAGGRLWRRVPRPKGKIPRATKWIIRLTWLG